MKDIHSIRNGSGLLVLSTPKGILSGKEARKEQVGGEALFKIMVKKLDFYVKNRQRRNTNTQRS